MIPINEAGDLVDNVKFGCFISELRKEKGWTQLELAEKIHVTDKAVSKWERGVGFPDIKLIEPLADALDVSLVEIMLSRKNPSSDSMHDDYSDSLSKIIDVAEYQRKIERKNETICGAIIVILISLIFLFDSLKPEGMVMILLPFVILGLGIFAVVSGFRRIKKGEKALARIIIGVIAILSPLLIFSFLYFLPRFGGPIPK
jgi:transcriptional regulator with XRE-family HTH domain